MTDRSVSACIVTYNSADVIRTVLDSLLEYTQDRMLQIYVVDNCSTDNTRDIVRAAYPQVTLLESAVNQGFGAGHNQVLGKLTSSYHVIVNPDIRLTEDVLSSLAQYLDDNPDVVMVTPKILNEDGTEQFLPKRRPKIHYLLGGRLEKRGAIFQKWRDAYTRRKEQLDKPTEIDFSTGCFTMIRTEVFEKLGGFDEGYFMYFEDADLTRRAQAFGKTLFLPSCSVVHTWERASTKSTKYFKIQLRSMLRYFGKWAFKR